MAGYALILAGGRGERLRPLTDNIPKPMVPLLGKPLLWHQVQWLKHSGITNIVFLAGYRWEVIQDYFGDGNRFDVQTHYSIEKTPLGRGGAIRKGLSSLPPDVDSVVVLNGDTITTQKLSTLIATHHQKKAANPQHLATIMVVPMKSSYRVVEINGQNDAVQFKDAPVLPYWINAGIYVLERSIELELPVIGDQEVETFPRLAARGRISAVKSHESWCGIDSVHELKISEAYFKQLGRGVQR